MGGGDMEIGRAGQSRKGLMGRRTAEIRPQVHGMAGFRQKPEIGPVGVVHQQQNAPAAAEPRQSLDLLDMAQVVGTGAVEGGDVRLQRRLHGGGVQGALEAGLPGNPLERHVQQRRRRDKGPVDVPGGGDFGLFSPVQRPPAGQKHHGPHGQRRALGRIEGRAAIEPPCLFLALPQNPRRLVETVGPGDLGQVPGLGPQARDPLVARHMEPQGVLPGIAPDKVPDRRAHSASRSIRSTARKMAHSIRLRKSLQPIS